MRKAFSINTISSVVFALWIVQVTSFGYAQTASTEEDCSGAQASFVSAMELFRSAFFEREDATGTAESVMQDQVLPSAEQMYQFCPAQVVAAVKDVVERANTSLSDPSREQVVQCDKALIAYKGFLSKFDNTSLSSYDAYRSLLYGDINPSAQTAIEACPEMTELAQQTRIEISERKTRLDRMEEMERFGDTMSDNIDTNNAIFTESFEDDDE